VRRIRFGTGAVPLLLGFIVRILLLLIVLDPLLLLFGDGLGLETVKIGRNVEAAFKSDKLEIDCLPFVGILPHFGSGGSFALASLKGGDSDTKLGDTLKRGRHGVCIRGHFVTVKKVILV